MTRKAWVLASLLMASAIAGCLDAADEEPTPANASPAQADSPDAEAPRDPWGNASRLRVLNVTWPPPPAWATGVGCLSSGVKQERTGEPVPPGTEHLAVTVDVEPGTTGLQAGTLFADHPPQNAPESSRIQWTPSQFRGEQTYEVDVGSDEVERPNGTGRWAFYWRVNPGVDELCWVGASANSWQITVDAVRAR